MRIQAVDYHFKNDLDNVLTGFLAQDLYQHFPEAVSEGGEDANENPWTVDYGRVTPLLVKAAQEQQSIIETHQVNLDNASSKLTQLEGGITQLNTKTASILQRLEALENTVHHRI